MNVESRQSKLSADLAHLEQALFANEKEASTVATVLDKIQKWAGQQPFLTKLICDYVIKYSSKITASNDADIVDFIVDKKIVKDWEVNGAATHLQKIQGALLNYDPRDSLLILYLQVLQGGTLPQLQSPEQDLLLRSGLVCLEDGILRVANTVYASIFNEAWIERQLPGITKPVAVIRSEPQFLQPSSTSANPTVVDERFSAGGVPSLQRMPFFNLPLKPVVAACSLAMLCAAIFVYFQKPSAQPTASSGAERTLATPDRPDDGERSGSLARAKASAPVEEMTPLTLLGDTFSGYSTFRNADFQAVLKESGIEMSYDNEFDQSLRAKALGDGKADLLVTSLDQFLQQQPSGKIVGLLDRTVGADAVVLNTKKYTELTSLLDLQALVAEMKEKGKKLSIAYAADTPSEYLSLVLDAQFDTFNLSDFELRPVTDASEAWALMQNPTESVAIAVLWEPFVAQARQKDYTVVLSSKDDPNSIVDVIVASDQLIASNPDIISRLLERYYRRIDANARDATQLQTQVAEDGELSVSDAATIIDGIDFFSATQAKNWFNNGTLAKSIEATAAVLTLSNRLAGIPTDASALYTDQFVTEAADNTQALIDLVRVDNPALANKLAGNLTSVENADNEVSIAKVQQASDIGNLRVSGQVSFSADSAELTQEGKQTLEALSKQLKEYNPQTVAVRVIGHTSRTGDARANQSLSQSRAERVAQQLKSAGVTLTILPEGKGFGEPLTGVPPEDARNQRTEIRMVRLE